MVANIICQGFTQGLTQAGYLTKNSALLGKITNVTPRLKNYAEIRITSKQQEK